MLKRLLSGIRRARGRSSHELFSRAQQSAYAWSERVALQFRSSAPAANPLARFGGNSALFAHPFFGGAERLTDTIVALRAHAPNDEAEILERAAAAARGQVAIFGHGLVDVGVPPQWQRDPIANLTAPNGHWSTVPFLNPAIVGDHKVVWEINRHQYFITLGQAWLYSGDERWPNLFAQHARSWIAQNPPTVGMNWASSLEISYRAIAWIWAVRLMHQAPVVDQSLKAELLQSLEAHGRHLERYLSTYFSPNTHLTGEALGLFYIGTQCPELPDARKWTELGASVLERTLSRQVLPDGVYFEQASQYHRYTIEIYLHYLLLARANSRTVGVELLPALHRLFDVLLHLTRNDGSIPLIGDDDGGRLLPVDVRAPHDVRSLLAIGAVVLQRSDLAWLGRGDDAMLCWLLGAESVAARDGLLNGPPADTARAFTDGGVYVVREGWCENDGHAAIDGGPHGALSFGHSHADALSVELSVAGGPLFVDAGTYTYVGADRNAFRTTAAHNTVEIDGESACVPDTAFRWRDVTSPTVSNWVDDEAFTLFAGSQNGYRRLASPVLHTRSLFHPAAGVWVIRDDIQTTGSHDVAVRWRCAPGLRAARVADANGVGIVALSRDGHNRALLAFMADDANLSIEDGFVSPQFGARVPVPVCVGREKISGDASMVSVVLDCRLFALDTLESGERMPPENGAQKLSVRSIADGSHHTLLAGGSSIMTLGDVQIDATLAWVSHDAGPNSTRAVTAVGVRSLCIGAESLLSGAAPDAWVVAQRNLRSDTPSWIVRTPNSSTRA